MNTHSQYQFEIDPTADLTKPISEITSSANDLAPLHDSRTSILRFGSALRPCRSP